MRRGLRKAAPRGKQEERDAERFMGGEAVPSKGFCHECESFVDEAAGKLHRRTCRGVSAERRAS